MLLMEAVSLRVKDVELSRQEIIIHDGKGGKDRVTMLPSSLLEPMQAQRAQGCGNDDDLYAGFEQRR